MTHCRKSHVTAHAFYVMVQGDTFCMLGNLACFLSSADFFFHFFPLKVMTKKNLNADIKQHEKQSSLSLHSFCERKEISVPKLFSCWETLLNFFSKINFLNTFRSSFSIKQFEFTSGRM